MYQILIILPEDLCSWVRMRLKRVIRRYAMAQWKAQIPMLGGITVSVLFDDEYERLKWNNPVFAVYVSCFPFAGKHEAMIHELMSEGIPICPVYLRRDVRESLPSALMHYQAIDGTGDFRSVAQKVMSAAMRCFRLVGKRKIFISYSQREGKEAAFQLYAALVQKQYKPFLDVCEFSAPCVFQEELEHELMDCDVMLVLDSGANRESDWCKREIALAHSAATGIVLVTSPYARGALPTTLAEQIMLHAGEGSTHVPIMSLGPVRVNEILSRVDSIQARAYAARQKRLYDSLCVRTGDNSWVVRYDRNGYHFYSSRHNRLVYPVVGVPQSEDVYRAERSYSGNHYNSYAVAYNGFCLKRAWETHFDWLSYRTDIELINL